MRIPSETDVKEQQNEAVPVFCGRGDPVCCCVAGAEVDRHKAVGEPRLQIGQECDSHLVRACFHRALMFGVGLSVAWQVCWGEVCGLLSV